MIAGKNGSVEKNSSSGSRWKHFSTETLEAIRERLETAKAKDDLRFQSGRVLKEILGQLSSRKDSAR